MEENKEVKDVELWVEIKADLDNEKISTRYNGRIVSILGLMSHAVATLSMDLAKISGTNPFIAKELACALIKDNVDKVFEEAGYKDPLKEENK